MNRDHISTVLKGLVIGGTMLVPGVSGGSMAITLGIYNRLISSLSSIRRPKKETLVFLSLFVLGAGVGMLLFANPLLTLINRYQKPTLYFFLGAVAGAIPMIYKQARVKTFSLKCAVYVMSGVLIVCVLSILPTDLIHSAATRGVRQTLLLLAAGLVAAVALILPGISVSYFLLLMGLYDMTMQAISGLDVMFLLPLAAGLMIGILLATKLLDQAMTKYPQTAYLIILGFIIGSIAEAFPGVPMGWEWILCILTASAGFRAIAVLSNLEG